MRLAPGAAQNRRQAAAVERRHRLPAKPRRTGGAGQLREGGEEVDDVAHLMSDRAGPDDARPGGDQRGRDAALVVEHLVLAERRVAGVGPRRVDRGVGVDAARIPLRGVVDVLAAAAVVGQEQHQRVLLRVQLAQLVEHPPDAAVHALHHGGVDGHLAVPARLVRGLLPTAADRVALGHAPLRLREAEVEQAPIAPPAHLVPADQVAAPIAGDVLGRRLQREVGGGVGEVEQERLLAGAVAVEEGDRAVAERVGGVEVGLLRRERPPQAGVVAPVAIVAGRLVRRLRLAGPAEAGIEVVAAAVDQPPVAVEAALHRQFAAPVPVVPLPGHQGAVAGGAQQLGEGDVVAAGAEAGSEVSQAHLVAVLAGEQRGAGGDAHRVVVEVGEAQSAGRQAVEIRGGDLAAVAAQVAEPQVVGHDQHDVRARRGGLRHGAARPRRGRRRRFPSPPG